MLFSLLTDQPSYHVINFFTQYCSMHHRLSFHTSAKLLLARHWNTWTRKADLCSGALHVIQSTASKHTHTRLTALFRNYPLSRYQKGKTNLDFTEARDSEWQWHQLGHMQVCISIQTDNHASTPPLVFLQDGCPSCRPTNSVKALKANTASKQWNDNNTDWTQSTEEMKYCKQYICQTTHHLPTTLSEWQQISQIHGWRCACNKRYQGN